MRTQFSILLWSLLFLGTTLLSGCGSARVAGLYGDTFISTDPALQVSVTHELLPVAHGRHWSAAKSDVSIRPTVSFRYALFGDSGAGTVQKQMHVIQTALPDKRWRFDLETARPHAFSFMNSSLHDKSAIVQIFPVMAATDWFSQVWLQAGRDTPVAWLAKRWSTTSLEQYKVVIEYREALPEDMAALLQQSQWRSYPFVTAQQRHYLEEFSARADSSLQVTAVALDAKAESVTAPSLVDTSASGISIDDLVGSVEYLSRGDNEFKK